MAGRTQYFIKRKDDTSFIDMEVEYLGMQIIGFDGFDAVGKPTNVSVQKWVNSNKVDVYIPETIYREANEVEMSFIFTNQKLDIDVKAEHDRFISDLTSGIISLKSGYLGEMNDFICVAEYKPSETTIQRQSGLNHITGTIRLQKLNAINSKF